MIRLFVSDALRPDAEIIPDADQARYLTQVMRLGMGDGVAVFNGQDGEWQASLSQVTKRGCVLRLETCLRPQTAGPDLDLVVALIKRAQSPRRDAETALRFAVIHASMQECSDCPAVFCKGLEFLMDRVNAMRVDAANAM
jgi:hypothetical protein